MCSSVSFSEKLNITIYNEIPFWHIIHHSLREKEIEVLVCSLETTVDWNSALEATLALKRTPNFDLNNPNVRQGETRINSIRTRVHRIC
jgi:hypothetical protein